ncbi:MAG: type I phosphomannose isomerase catalytic subunit [Planctomycetota bacterium]
MIPLAPCLLDRKMVPKVWGGRQLGELYGIDTRGDEPIGETWEVYDRPDGSSPIRGTGATLRDVMQGNVQAWLGRGVAPAAGGRFPLALKFVDAAAELSVQVHPDDGLAASRDDSGKSEAWVVVHAGPEACIRCGFRQPTSRDAFAAALEREEVVDLLESYAPKVGDTFHVPAGTVHALGPNVVVWEIQQNSDITFRLYDWGRPREMHVPDGLEATTFGASPSVYNQVTPIDSGGEWLVRDPHFRVRRFVTQSAATLGTEGTFKLLTVLRGRATIGWRSNGRDEPLRMAPGDTALVPADAGAVFVSPIGELELLVVDPGEVV